MSTKVILTLVLLLLAPLYAHAQTAWSLERCIEHACSHSISVRQRRIDVSRREAELLQDKLGFIPGINADIGHNLSWGRSVDLQNLEIIHNRLSQSTSMSITASAYVLDGLSKLYALRGSRISLDISRLEVEREKDIISLSVTKSYLQVMLSHEVLEAARESAHSTSVQRDRIRLLVESGARPYSDLLDMESQLASEEVTAVEAENRFKADLLNLRQLMSLDGSEDFLIEIPDIEHIVGEYAPENADEVFAAAQAMPVIRSAVLAVDKGEMELRSAKGQLFPKISVSAGYGTFYSSPSASPGSGTAPFFRQIHDNINPSLSIGLSIPIFNSWSAVSGIREAELNRRSLELQLESTRQSLYKDIQNAVLEAASCFRKMQAARIHLSSKEESMRYVEEKYGAGVLNSTDYAVAKTDLFKARSEYLRAKYQFVFQARIVDFYKGIPFSL
ncbi:MAG TPA: TolC family protein [Candidatus Coprenecus pullistercoris]|nr:TolC family protein [Candidatus Coprenecus pullistercoris]